MRKADNLTTILCCCHSSAKVNSYADEIIGIISIMSENKWEYNWAVHQLFTGVTNIYDSVRMEVLHNTVNEFGMSMKPGRIMCLYETYINICHVHFPLRMV